MMDERDDMIRHFMIFADKNKIYAYDPLINTRLRVIGNDFINVLALVSDGEDSNRNILFIADNNDDNTNTTIYKFLVSTNFSDEEYYEDEYYEPSIILDYNNSEVVWNGPAIVDFCLDEDEMSLYWAIQSE